MPAATTTLRRLARGAARPLARALGEPLSAVLLHALRLTGRQAGVALMYHSVEYRRGDPDRELVPPHEAGLFEAQVRHLVRRYRVVPAAELQEAARARRRGERFPVAITFDDDLSCHAEIALPILRRAGVTATFFLSGASLEEPFAFWYERLQRAVDEAVPGLPELVTGRAAATGPTAVHELGLLVEHMEPAGRDAVAARLADALGDDPPGAGIRAGQVRALAESGMTVGFHTRRHDSLPWLSDAALRAAMVDGRDALAAAAGVSPTTIGYPHGRADERVAAAARDAGFVAGFTTRHVPVTPAADPLLQGRIGPSLRSVGALAVLLVLTLARPGSGRARPAPASPAS